MVQEGKKVNLTKQKLPDKIKSIGTDPEVFLFNGNNQLIPAFEILPFKDDAPILKNNHKIFWDGFQAEWNYNGGRNSIDELIEDVRLALASLNEIVKKHDPKGYISLQDVVRVDDNKLQTLEEVFIMLGCMPSYNAYRRNGLQVDDCRKLKHRFAGGHLIFNLGGRRPDYLGTVRMIDKVLGIWSVGAARNFDNPIRRQYYGLAGEFRMPRFGRNFGIEYRTLSNFWLASPELMRMTWYVGRQAMALAHSKQAKLWAANDNEVEQIINTLNVDAANDIIKRNEPMFDWLMQGYAEACYEVAMFGAAKTNLNEAWGI